MYRDKSHSDRFGDELLEGSYDKQRSSNERRSQPCLVCFCNAVYVGLVTPRMDDGKIHNDILYGELEIGKRSKGRPLVCFKDVCNRDLKSAEISIQTWGDTALDQNAWKHQSRHCYYRQQTDKKGTEHSVTKSCCIHTPAYNVHLQNSQQRPI